MNTTQRTQELFDQGYCCAESVLAAFAEQAGQDPESYLKIATGHCAGLGGTSGTCGALTGAAMAVGLTFGRKDSDAPMKTCFANTKTLKSRFKFEFKSTNCTDLLGLELGTEDGMEHFQKLGLRTTHCRRFTIAAAEMAQAIINAD